MFTKNCREQNNATEADLESMMEGKLPDTPAAKCTMTCTMKEFKIVIMSWSNFAKNRNILNVPKQKASSAFNVNFLQLDRRKWRWAAGTNGWKRCENDQISWCNGRNYNCRSRSWRKMQNIWNWRSVSYAHCIFKTFRNQKWIPFSVLFRCDFSAELGKCLENEALARGFTLDAF